MSGVFFVAVARLRDRIVVASYSHNAKIDSAGVHDVLEQPNLKGMLPGRNYSFSVSDKTLLKGVSWHLRSDEANRVFIVITAEQYPQRCAVQLVSELARSFTARAGEQVDASSENGLSRVTSGLLSELCARFDDPRAVDTLAKTVEKVESVKLIMQENIEQVLANTVQLDHIAETAENLNDQASVFKRNAKDLRKKMWWKKLKMTLLMVFIITVILIAIAVPVAIFIQSKETAEGALDGGGGNGGSTGDDSIGDTAPSPTARPTPPQSL